MSQIIIKVELCRFFNRTDNDPDLWAWTIHVWFDGKHVGFFNGNSKNEWRSTHDMKNTVKSLRRMFEKLGHEVTVSTSWKDWDAGECVRRIAGAADRPIE